MASASPELKALSQAWSTASSAATSAEAPAPEAVESTSVEIAASNATACGIFIGFSPGSGAPGTGAAHGTPIPRSRDTMLPPIAYDRPHSAMGREAMATVMVVEDDPAFLKRFCGIIASDPDLELFAAVPDCASARQALHNAAPDVLLTDLGLPDGSSIDIIREASRRFPATDTVVITVFGDEQYVIAAIEAGATGYILKDSIPEQFVGLIKELRAGGSPISPVIARQLLKRFKAPADGG